MVYKFVGNHFTAFVLSKPIFSTELLDHSWFFYESLFEEVSVHSFDNVIFKLDLSVFKVEL